MKKGYRKCISCEKSFDYESFGFTAEMGENAGKPVCDECWNDDGGGDAVATIIFSSQGDRDTFHLGSYSLHGEYDESMRPEVWEYARNVKWIASSVYRGSYQGKAPDGWKNVLDSWFGTIDGHNVDGDLEKFQEKWENEKKTPDFDLIVGFPRTSNVCSCGIEIYVKTGDKKQFLAWLNS